MTTYDLGEAATLLRSGEMKLIELDDDQSVVLARRDDTYYAFGSQCTHYGGPLEQGVLNGHTVICPWHHACFDIRTGVRQEPPALDPVTSYPVTVEGGRVWLQLEPAEPAAMASIADDETYIIVGGGAAGEAAAEELRRAGFAGKIILLSAAATPPVDRPNLSKQYMAGEADPDWIPLRSKAWYAEHDIDLRLETPVTSVDTAAHTVTTDNDVLQYHKLLLATGSHPRVLSNVPGIDLDDIFTLRHQADADRIIARVDENTRVVIVGGSFIGMEVAASLGQRGASVTVVDVVSAPFEPILGADVGRFWQRLHESNGVTFRLDTSVARFHEDNGRVSAVELEDGTRLMADLVVLGVGVTPATDFLSSSDIAINPDDQSVRVDHHLHTSAADVYAAGDIARYPLANGDTQRIEHWRVAQQHGMIAARNMLGQLDTVTAHVPFFWTAQWGTRMRYVGFAAGWDNIVYRGDVEKGKFIAFYLKDGQLQAAAGVGHDAEMAALEFVLQHNLALTTQEMQNADFDLVRHVSTG